MIFIGLALAVAAIAAGTAVIMENDGSSKLSAFGETVPGVTQDWHTFLAGVVVAIIFMTGVLLFTFGFGRSMRTRRELRDLREEHEESITTLELEKRQLQRELARFRRGSDAPSVPANAQAPHHPVPQ